MPNSFFRFKQFTVHQEHCAMKVTTEACLFGAWASHHLNDGISYKNMLDIGAGTGLLSLMIAQQHKISIDAIELDEAAANQCRQNFEASPWHERLKPTTGDILTFSTGKAFDLIISNPPFYENDLSSPVKGKQLAHHSAGLSLQQLIDRVRTLLTEDGKFLVLLPYKRQQDIYQFTEQAGLHLLHQCTIRNSPNHPWFRLMAVFSPTKVMEKTEEFISIRDGEHKYTPEFIKLLQSYYLHL